MDACVLSLQSCPRGVRPRLEGKQRTALSSRATTRISWSPLSGLKGVNPPLQFGAQIHARRRRALSSRKRQAHPFRSGKAVLPSEEVSLPCAPSCVNERSPLPDSCEAAMVSWRVMKMCYLETLKQRVSGLSLANQSDSVFLPGESRGRGSLVGCRLWGRTCLKHDLALQ